MYLLDTNVVSELRRPRPHLAVLDWIAKVPAEQLFVSAVTVGEIQAGIETTRQQDEEKAKELEVWLDKVLASYGVLPMDAPAFREWAKLMHRRSDTITSTLTSPPPPPAPRATPPAAATAATAPPPPPPPGSSQSPRSPPKSPAQTTAPPAPTQIRPAHSTPR